MSTSRRSWNRSSKDGAARTRTKPGRNVVVLASLLGSLTLASILLLVWEPAPLTPDAARHLVAQREERWLDQIYDTATAVKAGRWQCIYIHHSRGTEGNALTLGERIGGLPDHFLIGNGNGCEDGAIQVGERWNAQQAAGMVDGKHPLPQLAGIADRYISICLVGDFDQKAPTALQMQRLEELVQSLQQKLKIPGASVWAFDRPGSAAGIGQRFPVVAFSEGLLP